jgi:transposase-like protein
VVTYESIRRWVLTFGPVIARRLRARRPKPHGRWHLDEMVVRIGAKQMNLWRAVDAEGEVLDVLLQAKRDSKAARRLMRRLLKKQGMAPDEWVTDKNPAYGAALRELRLSNAAHTRRKRANNRAESSHVPARRRQRKLQGFKSPRSAQPTFPVIACGHLQHLHRASSSRLRSHLPALPSRGVRSRAKCGRRRGVISSKAHLTASAAHNVKAEPAACVLLRSSRGSQSVKTRIDLAHPAAHARVCDKPLLRPHRPGPVTGLHPDYQLAFRILTP